MCTLVAPCPGREVRVAPALFFGGMMLASLAAMILMSVVRSPSGWLVRLSYVSLVLLAVVGYVVISFSGGFGLNAAFLAGLLGTCGTALLAYVGIIALRHETSAVTHPSRDQAGEPLRDDTREIITPPVPRVHRTGPLRRAAACNASVSTPTCVSKRESTGAGEKHPLRGKRARPSVRLSAWTGHGDRRSGYPSSSGCLLPNCATCSSAHRGGRPKLRAGEPMCP
jgi:hypothetical protein